MMSGEGGGSLRVAGCSFFAIMLLVAYLNFHIYILVMCQSSIRLTTLIVTAAAAVVVIIITHQ